MTSSNSSWANDMKISIDILATADIGKEELETLIRETVERETKRQVARVEFKVDTHIEGYGLHEHEVTCFDGVHIVFEKEQR